MPRRQFKPSKPKRVRSTPRRENRVRCQGHRKFVAGHNCSVPGCMRTPVVCAHVDIGRHSMSMKNGDDKTISLCAFHHTDGYEAVHKIGWARFQETVLLDNALELAAGFAARSPTLRAYYLKHPEMKP